jgi:hypothetical protein
MPTGDGQTLSKACATCGYGMVVEHDEAAVPKGKPYWRCQNEACGAREEVYGRQEEGES